MRRIAGMTASTLMLMLFPFAHADAEPLSIDQNAWLNYAVIVISDKKPSNLQLGQFGTLNGISSVQISGVNDAYMVTRQQGELNSAVLYQAGWNTVAVTTQQGGDGWSGFTQHPTVYRAYRTDEGYLSYFLTGGFSFVSLTDPSHTWYSRFGRAR